MTGIHDLIPLDSHRIQHRHHHLRCIRSNLQTFYTALHQFFSCDLLDQLSVMDNSVISRNLGKLLQDMAGNHNRHITLLIQPHNGIPDLHNSLRIQPIDRLVKKQKIRFSHKSQPNAKSLLHSKGKIFCLFLSRI